MSSATQQRRYFASARTAPPRITIDEPVCPHTITG
jgi:hypothetical protein